jgi:hypoxanthine phosphoribosyltransferase
MSTVVLHDKKFKICMTAAQIDNAVAKVAEKINTDLKDVDVPIFLSILNGSFMFTADLMRKIEVKSDVVFVKLASYQGTESTGEVKQIVGLTKGVEGKTVVVVEDIVETGHTIEEIHKILKDAGAADIKICTLLYKPDAYKKDIPIDYAALQIPNDFIVGYGLDYNQLGRQYKDIYVLDESGE